MTQALQYVGCALCLRGVLSVYGVCSLSTGCALCLRGVTSGGQGPRHRACPALCPSQQPPGDDAGVGPTRHGDQGGGQDTAWGGERRRYDDDDDDDMVNVSGHVAAMISSQHLTLYSHVCLVPLWEVHWV